MRVCMGEWMSARSAYYIIIIIYTLAAPTRFLDRADILFYFSRVVRQSVYRRFFR